jgi:hypothetical protein
MCFFSLVDYPLVDIFAADPFWSAAHPPFENRRFGILNPENLSIKFSKPAPVLG